MSPDDLCRLIDTVNPSNEAGRITLITRFGAPNIAKHLPGLIRTIKTIGWIPFLGPQWEREQVEKRLGRKL